MKNETRILLTVMIVPQKHSSRLVNQCDRISLCVENRVLNELVALAGNISFGVFGYIRKEMSRKKINAYCI